ncbi:CLUMA_CG007023, isoform A [Clunio marinus]|uniref:CLUMA_CG007023, isoform A n=1 Tax=Clunio marinus TaxID=568069 RepID=A0A1J1HZF3_9DIPT|nr:CLUMA_CG007023, isoform A [Clunio marinus]
MEKQENEEMMETFCTKDFEFSSFLIMMGKRKINAHKSLHNFLIIPVAFSRRNLKRFDVRQPMTWQSLKNATRQTATFQKKGEQTAINQIRSAMITERSNRRKENFHKYCKTHARYHFIFVSVGINGAVHFYLTRHHVKKPPERL